MIAAIPYKDNMIFPYFGRSEYFMIYHIDNGMVIDSNIVRRTAQGPKELADFMDELGVDVIICGGIGPGMSNMMESHGIDLYPGVTGYADDAADALAAGVLKFSTLLHQNSTDTKRMN